jgi:hypothetical protein
MGWQRASSPARADPAAPEAPAWGGPLSIWMGCVVLLHAMLWASGIRPYQLAKAVEHGVARVERRLLGEESQDIIRKEIQLQRDTIRFWTVITALGDFLIAPLWLALRAMAVAVALSAWAAIRGRPPGFPLAWADCVRWQGIWVLGLAVQVVLMVSLDRTHVDSSLLLLLPPGTYSARTWFLLRELDWFALIGWLSLAWGGCRRGQAGLLAALGLVALWAAVEISILSGAALVVNLGIRLSLMP